MKTVAVLMFAIVTLAASGIALLGSSAYAYRFEDVCPAQAPPGSDQSQWTQFRDACIRDDSARDRPFFDQCLTKCAVAAAAEGFKPPTPAPPVTNESPIVNPNWCGVVPASPPPPHFETRPGDWERVRQACMRSADLSLGSTCSDMCLNAEEAWQHQRAGDFNQTPTANWPPPSPNATRHTEVPLPGGGTVQGYSGSAPHPPGAEGPFPLPGGSKGYILHPPAAPSISPSPSASQSSGDPPGPFYSFAGEDDNAETAMPPDAAADISLLRMLNS